jgi:hypothetical protein
VGAWPVSGTWQGRSNVVIFVVLFAKVPGVAGVAAPAQPPRPRPAVVAAPQPAAPAAEPAPPPPPPPAPEATPTGEVLDAFDRLDQPLHVASALTAPSQVGMGPAFVAGVVVRVALLAAPLGVLRFARWRRVRIPGR